MLVIWAAYQDWRIDQLTDLERLQAAEHGIKV